MIARGARIIAAAMLCSLLGAALAEAQGRGNAFGHNKRPSGAAATSSSATDIAVQGGASIAMPETGVRAFGSWLDDATVIEPGSGYVSFSAGYWRMPGFTEFDVPAFDVGVGLGRRLQVGASVPVYHAREPGGPISRGVGDLVLTAKLQLRDPAASRSRGIGVAVTPMLDVSSVAPEPGSSRTSWALPASLEWQSHQWRAYGSVGYFSRGAIFTSGAFELPVSNRTWLTGTVSQSRSIKDDGGEMSGIPRVRTDVSGGATFAATPTIAVFGSAGRTLSRIDPNRSNLSLVAGVSMNFAAWQP